MPVQRVTTGIAELDKTIEGGFKKNSVNVVQGGPGSGKSIMAMQFLIEGIKNGEPGAYLTFEETREELIEDLESFKWPIDKYEKEKKLGIISLHPAELKQEITKESWNVWYRLVKEIKVKRIVIDSVSAYALLFDDGPTRRDAINHMFKFLREAGCTAVLTYEHEKSMDSVSNSPDMIEFLADAVIVLYNIRKGDVRERALEVKKIRGTKQISKIMPMKINNAGIEIFPEETLF